MTETIDNATSDWRPFTGDYEKQFYEVKRDGHALVVKHLWPNAGKLFTTDGQGLVFEVSDRVLFRPCTCGHKYGGCHAMGSI